MSNTDDNRPTDDLVNRPGPTPRGALDFLNPNPWNPSNNQNLVQLLNSDVPLLDQPIPAEQQPLPQYNEPYIPSQGRRGHQGWGDEANSYVLQGAARYPGVSPGPYMPQLSNNPLQSRDENFIINHAGAFFGANGSTPMMQMARQLGVFNTGRTEAFYKGQLLGYQIQNQKLAFVRNQMIERNTQELLKYRDAFATYGDFVNEKGEAIKGDPNKLKDALWDLASEYQDHQLEAALGVSLERAEHLLNDRSNLNEDMLKWKTQEEAIKKSQAEREQYEIGSKQTEEFRKSMEAQGSPLSVGPNRPVKELDENPSGPKLDAPAGTPQADEPSPDGKSGLTKEEQQIRKEIDAAAAGRQQQAQPVTPQLPPRSAAGVGTQPPQPSVRDQTSSAPQPPTAGLQAAAGPAGAPQTTSTPPQASGQPAPTPARQAPAPSPAPAQPSLATDPRFQLRPFEQAYNPGKWDQETLDGYALEYGQRGTDPFQASSRMVSGKVDPMRGLYEQYHNAIVARWNDMRNVIQRIAAAAPKTNRSANEQESMANAQRYIDQIKRIIPQFGIHAQALLYGDAKMQETGAAGTRNDYWPMMRSTMMQLDPTWNESRYAVNNRTRMEFEKGTILTKQLAINTTLQHIGTLTSALQMMQNDPATANTKIKNWNDVRNYLAKRFGTEKGVWVVAFDTALNHVQQELTRAFRGSAGAVHDLVQEGNLVNANASPGQIMAYLRTDAELLNGQMESMSDFFNRGTFRNSRPEDLLSPNAHRELQRIRDQTPWYKGSLDADGYYKWRDENGNLHTSSANAKELERYNNRQLDPSYPRTMVNPKDGMLYSIDPSTGDVIPLGRRGDPRKYQAQ